MGGMVTGTLPPLQQPRVGRGITEGPVCRLIHPREWGGGGKNFKGQLDCKWKKSIYQPQNMCQRPGNCWNFSGVRGTEKRQFLYPPPPQLYLQSGLIRQPPGTLPSMPTAAPAVSLGQPQNTHLRKPLAHTHSRPIHPGKAALIWHIPRPPAAKAHYSFSHPVKITLAKYAWSSNPTKAAPVQHAQRPHQAVPTPASAVLQTWLQQSML